MLNEEGIDYNYEFLKSKTSSQNINKLLNLKKGINTFLRNDYSAENHVENIKSKTLTCTIDIEKWINFIYHKPSVQKLFTKEDLRKIIELHKKRLLFINNHSLKNGSKYIGNWLIDKQTGDPSINLISWPHDINDLCYGKPLDRYVDLEANEEPDENFIHDWYEENINIIEELKTGNCLVNDRGCFINSNGTEYGYWYKDRFVKKDIDEERDNPFIENTLDNLNSDSFYKFEDKDTFTPLNNRVKKSFNNFKKERHQKLGLKFCRVLDVNKGLPFTSEEFAHAKIFLNEGAKASDFRKYFQRSIVTIALYFIKKTDISKDSLIKKLFK